MQYFCCVITSYRKQRLNLHHWFQIPKHKTLQALLRNLNILFAPKLVHSIAFTEEDDLLDPQLDVPLDVLSLSNPCIVNITLSTTPKLSPLSHTYVGESAPDGKVCLKTADEVDREFVAASYLQRLEMIGISVKDLELPVWKFTGASIVVCKEDERETSEFSTLIDFRDLLAVAFGTHPSVFPQTFRHFYRMYPKIPSWWPDNVPYESLVLHEIRVEQKKSLYTALRHLFGIDTPVEWKRNRRRRKHEMEEERSRDARSKLSRR